VVRARARAPRQPGAQARHDRVRRGQQPRRAL